MTTTSFFIVKGDRLVLRFSNVIIQARIFFDHLYGTVDSYSATGE